MGMVAKAACGAAAAIVVSERFLVAHGSSHGAVEIVGQALRTDKEATFEVEGNPAAALANLCGFDGSRRAADAAFQEAGITPSQVDVVELHDAFASSEPAMVEALRLCDDGAGARFVEQGAWRHNGAGGELFHHGADGKGVVVNPSGGLESKGHPTGATGLAQCAELCWQLRGVAGKRQVAGAKYGLQHNYGWSSAAVVTVYAMKNNVNETLSRL
jgi:sterol carrier protein 2